MAQVVLAVVSIIVEIYYPGAGQYVWAVGNALLAATAPGQKVSGPRLNDLRLTTSSYGAVIPILEGHPRTAGAIIWASPKREVQTITEVGGKGSPVSEITEFSYEIDVFYLVSANAINDVLRVWSDGAIIYTSRVADGAFAIGRGYTEYYWIELILYKGGSTQLPDPTYETAVGIGQAPAYRDRGTIMIRSLKIGTGGQLPNLNFEIAVEPPTKAFLSATYLGGPTGVSYFGSSNLWESNDVLSGYQITRTLLDDGPSADPLHSPALSYTFFRRVNVYTDGTVQLGAVERRSVYWVHEAPWRESLSPISESRQGGVLIELVRPYTFLGQFFTPTGLSVGSIRRIIYLQKKTEEDSRWFRFPADSLVYLDAAGTGIDHSAGDPFTGGSSGHNFFGDWVEETQNLVVLHVDSPRSRWVLYSFLPDNAGEYSVRRIDTNLNARFPQKFLGGFPYHYLFAWNSVVNAAVILKIDAVTLATVETISPPVTGEAYSPIASGSVSIYWGQGTKDLLFSYARNSDSGYAMLKYEGVDRGWRTIFLGMLPISGTSIAAQSGPGRYSFDGQISGRDRYRVTVQTKEPVLPTLANVVSRLCLEAGLQASEIDVTGLTGKTVRAFGNAAGTTPRSALEILQSAFLFDSVETNGKIKFVLRGGAPALTIPFADMGAGEDTGVADPVFFQRKSDLEKPAYVALKYANVSDSHQAGLVGDDRTQSEGNSVTLLEIPVGMTPAEARILCGVYNQSIQRTILGFEYISVGRKYSALEPTDVFNIVDEEGTPYTVRSTKRDYALGVHKFELELEAQTGYASTSITDVTQVAAVPLQPPGPTLLAILDIPMLRDADNTFGPYVAARGITTSWAGCRVMKGSADIGPYSPQVAITDPAIIGTTIAALGNHLGGNLLDTLSTLKVFVGTGVLSSDTHDNVLAFERNALLVGSEIIQFLNATLVATGEYTLSYLLRGRRGTEWAIGTHQSREPVVLLKNPGLKKLNSDLSEFNITRFWYGQTLGSSNPEVSDSDAQAVTGVVLKPYAPVNLRATKINGGGNITLTWDRRTRFSKNFSNGSAPLGEVSELYSIEIYSSGAFTTLKRTLASAVQSVVYTSAAQVIDFGANQTTIFVRVYQISDSVGRGTAASATL